MTRRIFRAVCVASLAVLCVTLVLVFGVLYDYFSNVQRKQLRTETILTAGAVNEAGGSFLKDLSEEEHRVTWVSADGKVLYDTASDTGVMENHLEREEIQNALNSGHGESSRYSKTLMERYLYCAERLADGTVLRLSVSHGSIFLLLLGMLQPILIIVSIAVILSFILANRLAKRIVEPMNSFDLDAPLEQEGYPELSPLFRRIHNQQQQLRMQAITLQRKQKELDTIVGSMEEGMLLLDSGNDLLTINHAARELIGARDAGTGSNILDVTDHPVLLDAVQTASAGTPCTRKMPAQGKTIRISASPVQTEQGVSGTAVVLFDITQEERAEQQRREFTANVSHELKTPLQSISGFSELLRFGMVSSEDIQPFAGKIYSEAQRLIALVQDIINLSQLDEGGKGMRWKEVDLLEEAKQVMQTLLDVSAQNEVTMSLEGESSPIYAAPELVHDILYNLCENAIKYNRPGGTLQVIVGPACVTVKDSGIGIPPEHIGRIFERFYRVDKSHSKKVGGTGLGLSIVKHAAIILGADLHVSSRENEGTEVRVQFR